MHFMGPVYGWRGAKRGEEKEGLFFWDRKDRFKRAKVAHL